MLYAQFFEFFGVDNNPIDITAYPDTLDMA
jgi:hypothetical protein